MNDKRAFAVLATDVAVLTVEGRDLKVLLTTAKSKNFRGMPTLPGGLVGHMEQTEKAAGRILKDVMSVTDLYSEQLYTFGDPKRDPAGRVVSVAYLALLPWNKARLALKRGAYWQPVSGLPKLAYDHNEIVKTAVKRLKRKLTYTNIVFGLMPEEFTLSELQATYEAILGREIDKRNFRKKIRTLEILKKLNKMRRGEANRPAQIYEFKDRILKAIEIL